MSNEKLFTSLVTLFEEFIVFEIISRKFPFSFRFQERPESTDAPCRVKPDRPCPPSKYRTPSGVCNNVRHAVWGSRGAPFLKMLPAAYSDGK